MRGTPITNEQAEFIKANYKSMTTAEMKNALGLSFRKVWAYCKNNNMTDGLKREWVSDKGGWDDGVFFNVEKYKPETL